MKDLLVSLVPVLFVCLFGYFVFPVIKVQRPYTKSYIIAIMWRYNNRMQSYNGSLKKKFEEWIIIQLVRNFQKTQKLKYCSTSSLLQVLSDKVIQKTNKTQEKKILGRGQNLKDHWKCLPSNIWVFVRLCETKIGAKNKIMLHGCRQLYSLHESRRQNMLKRDLILQFMN